MDAEKLDEMVCDYQITLRENKELQRGSYLYATDADFRCYSMEQAEMIDSLTVPFDDRVSEKAFQMALEMWDRNKPKTLFKGHDKEYYEKLRIEANEKISNEEDKLEKAILIEKYGTELFKASEYFKVLEAVERIRSGKVWK